MAKWIKNAMVVYEYSETQLRMYKKYFDDYPYYDNK